MTALLVSIIATLAIVFGRTKLLDAKGPFCNNVIKNPTRRSCEMSSIDAKWPETTSATSKGHTLKDWQNSLEISSPCFENQPYKICSHSYFGDSFWPKKLLDAKGPFGNNIIKNPARMYYHLFCLDFKYEALPGRGSHATCLNFKTSHVSVYKCFTLLSEIKRKFVVFGRILEKGHSDAL